MRLEIDQNVAWLHLDRPPLNLFDTGLQLAVERALHEGLRPEEAARWATLVEQSRPVLESDGMEAVQTFLAERGVSIIPAIAITRALLGFAETPLRVAIDIVTTSEARQ